MQDDCRNVYRNARRTAGLTQERWAEVLGISVEAVRQYETDRARPSDEVALRMAEVAGQHIICYWHLLNKSRVAAAILPELPQKRLPEAVLGLLSQITAFREDGMEDLIRIASDGYVDASEAARYSRAIGQLQELISAALALQYAKGDEG